MTKKFRTWLYNGTTSVEEIVTLEDLGITKEEMEAMDLIEWEDVLREVVFNKVSWGWEEVADE